MKRFAIETNVTTHFYWATDAMDARAQHAVEWKRVGALAPMLPLDVYESPLT